MRILAIETSCDETAISIVDFRGEKKFYLLSDSVLSQAEIHKKYGGVYPALAKREHINNIFPLILASLEQAGFLDERKRKKKIPESKKKKIQKFLDRDEDNFENLIFLFENYNKPKIDKIAVTYGPGLEIALWTGFNIARSLAEIWDVDLIPVNHMEGHIYSSLIRFESGKLYKVLKPKYPALSLLISGGHTELVLIKKDGKYEKIGQTLDDAVGEAYDKTARLLKMSYPGGPEISKKASEFKGKKTEIVLPRPMLKNKNYDFSFSGLKTAVLYLVRSRKKITESFKRELSFEFENAVSEILLKKSFDYIDKNEIKSLIIGGGVSANNRIRREFKKEAKKRGVEIFLPDKKYTGDNALMIAIASFFISKGNRLKKNIKKVDGNLELF